MTVANRAVVHWDEDGAIRFAFDGDVELYVVDERVPHDRVYRITTEAEPGAIDALLGEDEIGHKGDARHKAAEHRIRAALAGEPHLKPV